MVQMALGTGKTPPGLAFAGVTASGWIADLLAQLEGHAGFEALAAPPSFHGTLRPYQERGYSWLAFLRRWRLGACLADDMGLGKTIQTLALIRREWEAEGHAPVLLVCPTSVVGNWQKEAARFTPNLYPRALGQIGASDRNVGGDPCGWGTGAGLLTIFRDGDDAPATSARSLRP